MSPEAGTAVVRPPGAGHATGAGETTTPLRRLGADAWKGARGYLPSALGLVALVLAWEYVIAAFHVPTFLLASPSAIGGEMFVSRDLLLDHSLVTLWESLGGFVLGALGGMVLAVVIVHSAILSRIIMPWLIASQVMPKIAIAPLILLWFGYGITSKIVIAGIMAIFPVVVAHALGMSTVPKDMLDLARSMRASRWSIFRKLLMPYSLPALFSGLKVASTLAVIGSVVGEFVGGSDGLGYLIVASNYNYNVPRMFASLILLMVIGVCLYLGVVIAERFFLRNQAAQWRSGSGEA